MTFKTRAEWELKGVYELFAPKEDRNYPLFEACFFGNYFIVDGGQIIKEEGEEEFDMGRRFFVSSFKDTLSLIKSFENTDIQHENITLLQGGNYSKTGDYNCSIIEEMIHCEDEAGQDAWIYLLKNEQKVIDSLLTKNEDELKLIDTFYKRPHFTGYGKSHTLKH